MTRRLQPGPAPAGPLRVAAVVVTYNRLSQLQITLRRLMAEEIDHVIVVDNASTDDTAAFLARPHDSRITVLRLAENMGGAGGFEAGMAVAADRFDPDWMVLLDDDARPMRGAMAEFRAAAAGIDPDAGGRRALGAVAAAVFLPGGRRVCEMNRPSRNPFWHPRLILRTLRRGTRAGFHLKNPDFAADAPALPIDVASFVGFFVSRGAVRRAGLPEGGLFIYGDDVLYSLRLRRAGLGIDLWPSVRFEHDCATMGTGFTYRPFWKVYYHCRNGVAIARQAAGPVVYPAALAWYILSWSRKAKHYGPEERSLYRSLMWQGIRDGLRGRRGRNDAVHQRVARADRKAALLGGATDGGRPVLMTKSTGARVPPVLKAVARTQPLDSDEPAVRLAAPPPLSTKADAAPRASAGAGSGGGGPKAAAARMAPAVAPVAAPVAAPAPAPAVEPEETPAKPNKGPGGRQGKAYKARLHPVAKAARFQLRHRGLLASFALIVLLPVLASASYLYLRAADQYASKLAFTVRSEETGSSASAILGGLSSLGVGSSTTQDGDILYEFIRSQNIVQAIDERLDLRTLYARHVDSDPLLGFHPEGSTIEDLTDYWQRMVRITYDASAGMMELNVLAFDPEEARLIAGAIFDESSAMINNLSDIAREDATRYAREDLDTAVERLKTAREALTAYRVQNQIVDPVADAEGQMGLLNRLQGQLAQALIELDLLVGNTRSDDPRLSQAQRRIAVIESRIAEERRKFGSGTLVEGGENYATTLSNFERMSVDSQFAERAYVTALATYDAAVAQANRQSRYLAAYIKPTVAEQSQFPQRGLIVGLVALFSFLLWSILSLVYYSLRDRR